MFCVINKQKIYSYLIASSMALILLAASIFLTNSSGEQNAMETWSETNTNVNISNSSIENNNINIDVNQLKYTK